MTPDFDFPRVTAVRPMDGYRLWLQFSDGVEGHVDLRDALDGPVFEPLRDVAYFGHVRLDPPFTIAWPNGADVTELLENWARMQRAEPPVRIAPLE